MKIGTLRAKDIRKIALIFYIGCFARAPPTQLRIRVVKREVKIDTCPDSVRYVGFVDVSTQIISNQSKHFIR